MASDNKTKALFKRLPWEEYEKLPAKKRDIYNKQEREANFNAKMDKKYGNSVERGTKKLSKLFG